MQDRGKYMAKVVIITNIPSPYRVDLFNYLHENYKDFDFNIVYSSRNEDNRSWFIDKAKIIKSFFLKSLTIKIKKRNDNKYIHIPYNTFSVLNELNPDIIIASEYNPTVIQSLIWCRIKRKKFISWSDGTLNSEKNINIIQKKLRNLIVKSANTLIASSTKTKEAQIFYGADEQKIHISYLTIDVEKFLFKRDRNNNINLLYVGSLIKRKGIDLLLDSLALIEKDFYLNIIGEGPEKENLIKKVTDLGIAEKINFLGFQDGENLKKYYKESDMFILPTREDCFGLVILEAMCNSMPLIISKYADGAYDLVVDGENGFIVDPYDRYIMKEKIEFILNDKEISEKMSLKSYEMANKYRFYNVTKEFVNAIIMSMDS